MRLSNLFALSISDWNIFVMYMKNNFNESWDCSDAVAVSRFFSQVCVLGAKIPNLPNNLYSLCNSSGEIYEVMVKHVTLVNDRINRVCKDTNMCDTNMCTSQANSYRNRVQE